MLESVTPKVEPTITLQDIQFAEPQIKMAVAKAELEQLVVRAQPSPARGTLNESTLISREKAILEEAQSSTEEALVVIGKMQPSEYSGDGVTLLSKERELLEEIQTSISKALDVIQEEAQKFDRKPHHH